MVLIGKWNKYNVPYTHILEKSYDVCKIGNDEAEVEYDEYEDDNLEEEGWDVDQNEGFINNVVMAILPPPGLVEIIAEPIKGSFSIS